MRWGSGSNGTNREWNGKERDERGGVGRESEREDKKNQKWFGILFVFVSSFLWNDFSHYWVLCWRCDWLIDISWWLSCVKFHHKLLFSLARFLCVSKKSFWWNLVLCVCSFAFDGFRWWIRSGWWWLEAMRREMMRFSLFSAGFYWNFIDELSTAVWLIRARAFSLICSNRSDLFWFSSLSREPERYLIST
jgi:hypothetical protein